MKAKQATISLIIVLFLLFVFLYKRWHEPAQKEAFDRHPSHLYYTKHALCRMNCRHISTQEIEEIMQSGIINLNMSDRNDKPCPTYAVQGETSEGNSLRIIFAQCNDETKVVTCYNLKKDFECHCPGDASTISGQVSSTLRQAQGDSNVRLKTQGDKPDVMVSLSNHENKN